MSAECLDEGHGRGARLRPSARRVLRARGVLHGGPADPLFRSSERDVLGFHDRGRPFDHALAERREEHAFLAQVVRLDAR
ncbi:MAG: hypothetical protein IPN34_04885 [Planctomycetes bacterium]|nr:hypothetical protein [Planctomycetota bacterium]